MKFSCQTKDILATINIVSRAITGQQAMPILNNILILAEGKRCTLSATNLEFSIISHFEAEVENEGSITIPAKAIQNFTQYNTDKEVVFESSEDAQLRCRSHKTKTLIAGEASTEYPTIPSIQKEAEFSITPQELFQTIYLVGFASARTTTRPVLSGVYFKVIGKELIVVATDSYRLSEYKAPIQDVAGEVECIVPAKVLGEVLSILGGAIKRGEDGGGAKEKEEHHPPIKIILSHQQIAMNIGRTTILSRLIDGTFPAYQQILPKNFTTKTILPHADFLMNVKRMHYFAKESNNNLTVSIVDDAVKIQTQTTQIGRDEGMIAATVRGEKNKIALSSTYLLDFLSHIQEEEVHMEIVDKMHPALFHVPGIPHFLHLIMPLRLPEEA